MWAKYHRHSAADGGGFRTQILRFFQPETQNYARFPRSVPTEHMLASKLCKCVSERDIVARTSAKGPTEFGI